MIDKDELMKKFEDFCRSTTPAGGSFGETEAIEEEDWHSLSIGFFIALGADAETCYDLATTARYTHQYWC